MPTRTNPTLLDVICSHHNPNTAANEVCKFLGLPARMENAIVDILCAEPTATPERQVQLIFTNVYVHPLHK